MCNPEVLNCDDENAENYASLTVNEAAGSFALALIIMPRSAARGARSCSPTRREIAFDCASEHYQGGKGTGEPVACINLLIDIMRLGYFLTSNASKLLEQLESFDFTINEFTKPDRVEPFELRSS